MACGKYLIDGQPTSSRYQTRLEMYQAEYQLQRLHAKAVERLKKASEDVERTWKLWQDKREEINESMDREYGLGKISR